MPEAASLTADGARVRVAGFWRRTLGAFIDGLVLFPLALFFGGIASVVAGQSVPRLGELGFSYLVSLAVGGGTAGVVALAMALVTVTFYLVIFAATSGQTPGQRAVGVRVIDGYGDSPSLPRAIVRAASLYLSLALFSLGCFWIAFSREKRGLHDLIAGTWVVRAAEPAAAAGQAAPRAAEAS